MSHSRASSSVSWNSNEEIYIEDEIKSKKLNNPQPRKLHCVCCSFTCRRFAYNEWYSHLLTVTHGLNSLSDGGEYDDGPRGIAHPPYVHWSHSKNLRSVVVSEVDPDLSPSDILHHFVKMGFVRDFIFDHQAQLVVICYDDSSSVDKIFSQEWNKINGVFVRVRCKDSISFEEWSIILEIRGLSRKNDHGFYVRNIQLSSKLEQLSLPLDHQMEQFIWATGMNSTQIQVQILGHLAQLYRPLWPQVAFQPLSPLTPCLMDLDSVFEVQMEPSGFFPCVYSANLRFATDKGQEVINDSLQWLAGLMRSNAKPPFSNFVPYPKEKIGGVATPSFVRGFTFTHCSSGMKCCLRFDCGLDAPFVGLQELLFKVDPRAISMLRILYHWARLLEFPTRYPDFLRILTILLVTYLMMDSRLPSVSMLQTLYHVTAYNNTGVESEEERCETSYWSRWTKGLSRGNSQRNNNKSKDLDQEPFWWLPVIEGWNVSFCDDPGLVKLYLLKTQGTRAYSSGDNNSNVFSSACAVCSNTSCTGKVCTRHQDVRSVLKLLRGFFSMISSWNPYTHVLSPFVGGFISRSFMSQSPQADLLNSSQIEHDEENYRSDGSLPELSSDLLDQDILCSGCGSAPKLYSPIVVQHPFDLARNVAHNMESRLFKEFQQACTTTTSQIDQMLFSSNPRLMDIFPENHLRKMKPRVDFDQIKAPGSGRPGHQRKGLGYMTLANPSSNNKPHFHPFS